MLIINVLHWKFRVIVNGSKSEEKIKFLQHAILQRRLVMRIIPAHIIDSTLQHTFLKVITFILKYL